MIGVPFEGLMEEMQCGPAKRRAVSIIPPFVSVLICFQRKV